MTTEQQQFVDALNSQSEEDLVIADGALDGSVANGALMSGTCCGSRKTADCKS